MHTLGVRTPSVRQPGRLLAQAHGTAFTQPAGLSVWFVTASEQATMAAGLVAFSVVTQHKATKKVPRGTY